MSYEFYKLIHLSSIIALFLSLGMLITGAKTLKKLIMTLHGLALLLLFISGFGLIAKLHIQMGITSWFWHKIAVFVILAGLTPLLIHKTEEKLTFKKALLFVSILLSLAFYAVWKVIYR